MAIAVVSMVGTPWDGDASPLERARATRCESEDAVGVLAAGREIPSSADSLNLLIRPLQERLRDRPAEIFSHAAGSDQIVLVSYLSCGA
jgi:hypothetical protein